MAGAPPPLRVVVVGSGLAGYGVVRELRKLAPDAQLTVITADDGHFYSKPALSTALAKGKTADTLVTTPGTKMAAQQRFELRAGRLVEALAADQKVLLTTGGPLPYDKLVLALGATPIRPALDGDGRAYAVNNLDDYRAFRERLPEGARVLILGAGLVGTEFANDLVTSGYHPVVVDMLSHPLAQLVPAEAGVAVRDALAEAGVVWHFGRKVTRLDRDGALTHATLDDGTTIVANAVLSAVGLRPNIDLAVEAGLTTRRGIIVDAHGQTSDPDIYAIGDCAEYPSGTAAYVTPIMAAARAIAPSLLGTPTPIHFPTLSVQVKTTLCPMVLLPVAPGTAGAWTHAEAHADGHKFLFHDSAGRIAGYVMTHDKCAGRVDLDREIGEDKNKREAA